MAKKENIETNATVNGEEAKAEIMNAPVEVFQKENHLAI